VVIARNAIVVIGALTVVSFAFQNLRVVSDASVQSTIADDSVGRVFSAYDVIYNLAFVGGAFAGVGVHAGASPEAIFLSLVTGYALGALALSAYARLPLRSRT
jgi:predicted MFS family arabinose efflux permease